MEELRCLVCQGQSIADSDAELAGDMRDLVRRRIAAGETAAPMSARGWCNVTERWISYKPDRQSRRPGLCGWHRWRCSLVGGVLIRRRIRTRTARLMGWLALLLLVALASASCGS